MPGVLWLWRHNEFFPIYGFVKSYLSNCWTSLTNVSVMFSFYNRISFSIRTANSNYLLWLRKGVVIHMWLPLWGEGELGGKVKMRCYGAERVGDSKCTARPIFIFLLKKIGFAPWPDIMLSQTIYYWQELFLLTLIFYCSI